MFTDPSFLFLASCLVAPLGLGAYEGTLTVARAQAFFLHPVPLVAALLCAVFLALTHRGKHAYDEKIAMWYLVNGFGFKSVMDTCSGSLQLCCETLTVKHTPIARLSC